MAQAENEFVFIKYSPDYEEEWDDFVENQSINGNFLQTRRFLNYHPVSRFEDVSLIVMDKKKEKMCAIIPGCRVNEDEGYTFFSHKGSTFGGIIVSKIYYKPIFLIDLVKKLMEYLIELDYKKIILKQTPNIFSKENTDLFQYVYQYCGFDEFKELNTYIDYSQYNEDVIKNLTTMKQRHVKKCKKNNFIVRQLHGREEIEGFYSVLCDNLKKYDAKPVHTMDELMDFVEKRLVNECEFWGCFDGNKIIAGAMMFYFKNCMTAHTQYLAADADYNKFSPMSFVYYSMIEEMKKRDFNKISFGVSTENLGQDLNEGLISSKASYGGAFSNNCIYIKNLDK